VAATIGVQRTPYSLDVSPDGKRAYVANSGSNTVSVIDLDKRRVIAAVATGEGPGMVRVSPDNRTLVVSNRVAGSVSIYSILPSQAHPLQFREAFSGCTDATDIVISAYSNDDLPSGAKAWVACSGSHRVMVAWLGAAPDSYRAKQDPALANDALLCFLDVGNTPTHIALKPDGGEVFTTNFDSDSISEISTWTNEVLGTYIIGAKPVRAAFTSDGSTLWVTNFGADSVSVYDVEDGRMASSVRTGPRPDALAFSNDEHLLLVADSGSADAAVIRTQNSDGRPTLFTMLPAGAQPNDLVVKSFNSSMSFGGQ
jgi:YVTN family beta-propeller protein